MTESQGLIRNKYQFPSKYSTGKIAMNMIMNLWK